MQYEVKAKPAAARDIKKFSSDVREAIIEAAGQLRLDPYPRGSKKLKGLSEEAWRLRVGDYRIIYTVDEQAETIWLMRARHRREVYEDL